MKKLLLPSGALALICACASLLITVVVVQGQMDGTAWLLSTICPLVIAFPSGMFFFWQREKLGNALLKRFAVTIRAGPPSAGTTSTSGRSCGSP